MQATLSILIVELNMEIFLVKFSILIMVSSYSYLKRCKTLKAGSFVWGSR